MPVLIKVAPAVHRLAECDHPPMCCRPRRDRASKPVDDDEIAAHRFAGAVDDLDRKADPVPESASPVVVPEVGLRRDELVDQVAFGTHDLDAVVAGVARKLRAADISGNRLADAPAGQPARTKARDRRAHRGGRDCKRVIGITASMQDLQRDLASRRMDRRRDQPVLRHLPGIRELRGARLEPAGEIRRDAAGDDECHAAARTLRVKRRHARMTIRGFLQSRMH
jgi:hypothetical protein